MNFIEILTIIVMLVFGICCLFGLLFVAKKTHRFLVMQNDAYNIKNVKLEGFCFDSINKPFKIKFNYVLDYLKLNEFDNCYKKQPFFLMQNNGGNPCEIEKTIEINHSFTEEQMYI